MVFEFKEATKEQAKARIALIGPSGSGKTYTGLRMAEGLGDKIAVIDTENSSASKYADEFKFSTLALIEFSPQTYIQAIQAAEKAGFDVLIIDSLSHAWMGKGGALEMVDKAAKRYQGNSFAAWRDVTPHHNNLVDALVHCQCHLIVTMRTKTDYVVQQNDKGKMEPKKIGLAPIQREGLDYEMDVVGDLDLDHNLIITKTRCRHLDNETISKPGKETAEVIKAWLSDGEEPRIIHWSEREENRQRLEKHLTNKGIPIETLFQACDVKDWADMVRYEAEGKEAVEAAVQLWEENKPKNGKAKQAELIQAPAQTNYEEE